MPQRVACVISDRSPGITPWPICTRTLPAGDRVSGIKPLAISLQAEDCRCTPTLMPAYEPSPIFPLINVVYCPTTKRSSDHSRMIK